MAKQTKGKTDPKKKTSRGTTTSQKKKLSDTQQLSDKLASKVAKGHMSFKQANKMQRKADSTSLAKTKINVKVHGSSQNLPTKRKAVPAKHRRNKQGNIERY